MDENKGPETRRRSRSKTPFILRSQCNKESCTDADHGHGPIIKVPDVITIIEEDSPETVSKAVRTSNRAVRKTASSEVVTTESHQTVKTTVVHQTTSTTSSSSNQSKESKQNAQNALHEDNTIIESNNKSMLTSTPIQNISRKNLHTTASMITSPIASPVFESAEDHAAYREYRNAGEYWNKYPKTDYTYSKLSPHRRELAPGMVAMPNMSRRSLEKHHDRVNLMAQANPEFESYIRKRYETRQFTQQQNRAKFNAMYDSQDEVDVVGGYESRRKSTTTTTNTTTSIFKRIIVIRWITSLVVWLYESASNVLSGHQTTDVYSNRVRDDRGWFKRTLSSIASTFVSLFTNVYLAISSVLFLDSWLLRTNSQGTAKKRFLLLLLILLPFLLLAAWRLQDSPSRVSTFSEIPSITLDIPSFLSAPFKFYQDHSGVDSLPLDERYVSSANSRSNIPTQSSPSFTTDDQYAALLQQLNRYVDTIVSKKFSSSEQTLSATIITNIANTMHEHITKHEFVLSAADADRVADLIRAQLMAEQNAQNKNTPAVLTNEHITLVSKLIKERVVLENQQHSPSAIDIDAIISQVLASPNLMHTIDDRITLQTHSDRILIQEQTRLIDALRDEIEAIKLKLDKNSDVQQHVDQTLILLQTHYDNLGHQFDAFKRENEVRFSNLLRDVNFNITMNSEQQFAGIDNRIKMLLLDIFGFKNKANQTPDDVDLRGWIHNVFVAKDMLEDRLKAIQFDNAAGLKAEINRSAEILMGDIGARIREQSIALIEANNAKLKDIGSGVEFQSKRELDEEEIKRIVAAAIAVYDADKTGLVDYALESAGGEIVSTRCTETYHTKTAQISIFGVPLWYPTNTPRTAISPTVQPGQCWAFQGFPGFLVLKLNTLIHVTGFTIEHIPRSLSPNGHIDSAPKTFTVWGLESENDHEPIQFGTYEFVENGSNLQYFPVQIDEIQRLHNIVELRIESNHGNVHYTCLYRFRVHGTPIRG